MHGIGDNPVMDWLHVQGQKNTATIHEKQGKVCGKVLSTKGHFTTP